MDTDEYAISLSRELAVCRRTIARIRKDLAEFKQRYGISTQELLSGICVQLSEEGIRA